MMTEDNRISPPSIQKHLATQVHDNPLNSIIGISSIDVHMLLSHGTSHSVSNAQPLMC